MKEKLKKGDAPFAMVAQAVLNDKRLSWKAKGIFAYLYGKPDGWDFAYKRIAQDATDGKTATLSGLQELEKAGYLSRQKLSTGRMEYFITWDNSQKPKPDNQSQAEPENRAQPEPGFQSQPEPGFPTVRKPHSAKTGPISNIDTNSNTDTSSNSAAKPQDPVNQLIDIFQKINPGINYGNLTTRKAAEWMITRFGLEKSLETAEYAVSVTGLQFAPSITTPFELKESLGKLIAYHRREKQKSPKGKHLVL